MFLFHQKQDFMLYAFVVTPQFHATEVSKSSPLQNLY